MDAGIYMSVGVRWASTHGGVPEGRGTRERVERQMNGKCMRKRPGEVLDHVP